MSCATSISFAATSSADIRNFEERVFQIPTDFNLRSDNFRINEILLLKH